MTNATDIHPDYAVGTWKLDPTHSEIAFSLKHLMISKVRGTFDSFDVTVVTAEDPRESTIEATIDIASVNTNQKDRDDHLRTGDFFLAEEYPTMTFTSTNIGINGSDLTITGDLTLRGVTKSVVLVGEFGGIASDGFGQIKAGATVNTTIDRRDFGVSFNAPLEAGGLTLGNDVAIVIDLQVILQK